MEGEKKRSVGSLQANQSFFFPKSLGNPSEVTGEQDLVLLRVGMPCLI